MFKEAKKRILENAGNLINFDEHGHTISLGRVVDEELTLAYEKGKQEVLDVIPEKDTRPEEELGRYEYGYQFGVNSTIDKIHNKLKCINTPPK